MYYLVTYGKRSATILRVSRRMSSRNARRIAENTSDYVDILVRY